MPATVIKVWRWDDVARTWTHIGRSVTWGGARTIRKCDGGRRCHYKLLPAGQMPAAGGPGAYAQNSGP